LPSRLLGNDPAEPAYPVSYSTRLEELRELARQSSAKRRTPKFAEVALVLPKTIFWEVDVEDFMLPGGSPYIPAPEKANLLSVNEFLSET